MYIAVTGGGGNFARVLIAHLHAQGHTVRSIDRPGKSGPDGVREHITADLKDYPATREALRGCDGVVHLAAYPGTGMPGVPDEEVYVNNTVISYHVLCAAGELGIKRLVQASSINALGGAFGEKTAFVKFPIDETQPCFAEDAYSLSKWVLEQQGDATARRFGGMTIASLRFHGLPLRDPEPQETLDEIGARRTRGLWGYTRVDAAARAVELALRATYVGHEVFFIVAPRTHHRAPSVQLAQRHYPDVPIDGDLSGNTSFFDSSKAARLLGWRHD
jgi:nucleoside-diphosphate-sugar epimerase